MAKRITASEARELLDYDPVTGKFVWRITRNNFVQKGRLAGSINAQGYISIKINEKSYAAHRLAWLITYGKWPRLVDHIDHCESNNSLSNLREVTSQENYKNRRLRYDNKSGISGVNLHGGKWQARIVANGKRISLGHFSSIKSAMLARAKAIIEYGYPPNHGAR